MRRLCWLLRGALLITGNLAGQAVTPPAEGNDLVANALPDSPGEIRTLADHASPSQPVDAQKAVLARTGAPGPAPCVPATGTPAKAEATGGGTDSVSPVQEKDATPQTQPCARINPYQRFLSTSHAVSLSPKQKGYLAVRDVADPFNLLTIVGNSAVTVGLDAHTPYGPGFEGFGRNIGVSLLQDVTGEFIGTFGVCSLFHQDPHYHRLPEASPGRRVMHAIVRTVVAQSDNGKLIPNYANLITYPASAEISNLYVPGIQGNATATWARILIGLGTDPANNLITEFLPDIAKRVHVRVLFVQQIINQVARSGEN